MNINNPTNISAVKQQAIALCQQRNFVQAKELLDRFAQSNQMDAESYSLLGSVNGQLGAFEEAVQCLQESIRLQSNMPQVHYGLGMALSKLGRFPEAEACFKAVVQLNPANLQAVLELAITELSQNKLSDAEVHFDQVIAQDSGSLKALMGLGRVYQALNKSEIAINYYKSVLEINPNIASAHHHLGSIYVNQGQIDLAVTSFNKALKIDPNNVQVHMEMGQLYKTTNKIKKAKESYQQALSIQPDNLDAIAGEAQLYEQMGDIKAAYDRVIPYIDKGIKHSGMGILFSKICRHFDRCVDAATYLEDMIEDTENTTIGGSQIYFPLGKLYDHLGEYDKAFLHFKEGNAQKADKFNRIEHEDRIDSLIKNCDWNFFIKAPRSTQKTERPVFIVGMPRSGTTLTEQILCSHPDVYGAGEISTFPNIILNLPSYLGAGTAYPDSLKNLSPEILDSLATTYLNEINKFDDKAPRVTDKTLANFLYLGLISLMFPNARIIHCKRDPRDTCLSIYFQNFDESHSYATKLENLGFYFNLYEKVMKHWKSILKIPILEVQYEEIVKDQEKVSRELIDFVGLEWDESVLKFYENKRSVVTASYDQVRQKIYTKSTARWKNYEKHIEPLTKALNL